MSHTIVKHFATLIGEIIHVFSTYILYESVHTNDRKLSVEPLIVNNFELNI